MVLEMCHIIVRLIVANKKVDLSTTHFKATITISLQMGDHLHPSPCLLQASQEMQTANVIWKLGLMKYQSGSLLNKVKVA